MTDRLDRAILFLDKLGVLQETEEYKIAKQMKEEAQWLMVRFQTLVKAGFSQAMAMSLLQADMGAPHIEMYFGDGVTDGDIRY